MLSVLVNFYDSTGSSYPIVHSLYTNGKARHTDSKWMRHLVMKAQFALLCFLAYVKITYPPFNYYYISFRRS
uniref:Uncharacterized protein n=1 Tax=Arundo donax TaxID=35708 RepID=A0A0A9CTE4_ARUDO